MFDVPQKLVDGPLMAKWKKPGYERLCSTYVINTKNYKFGTVSICRASAGAKSCFVECLCSLSPASTSLATASSSLGYTVRRLQGGSKPNRVGSCVLSSIVVGHGGPLSS